MKVAVYGAYGHITDKDIRDKTVILIDVLRMSSSIVMALENDAIKVIPIQEVEEAVNFSRTLDRNGFVLAGERESKPLPLFTLGNSPATFTKEIVRNKTVVITTSNGTSALHRVRAAKRILIGCMLNRTAVAEKALSYGDSIALVCAGNNGVFAAEDVYASGSIIDALFKLCSSKGENIELDDLGFVARELYTMNSGDIQTPLSKTKHYKELVDVGFGEDIGFCLQEDTVSVVPDFHDGIIVI